MTFKEWLFSSYDNPSISGQWGLGHIITLISCIALIVVIGIVMRGRSLKSRRIVLYSLVGVIFAFEIARRVINFCKGVAPNVHDILYTLLPRPWCAIACWSLIISIFVNKKWFYNFASITALLCALIFFAYPGVGFNNKYILFENLYSICTHSLLLVTSISLITMHFTSFKYKGAWRELICIAVVYIYSILEIYVLKISGDPLYFMPGNDILKILGVSWGVYLVIYILFMLVYLNTFYLIDDRSTVKSVFARKQKEIK